MLKVRLLPFITHSVRILEFLLLLRFYVKSNLVRSLKICLLDTINLLNGFHVKILRTLHCVFLTFVNGSLLQKCNFLVFIFATPLELNSNKFCDERNDQALDNFTSIFPTLTSEVRIQLIFITCPIMITYLYFSRTYGFVNKMINLTTLKACFGLVTLLDFCFGDTPMTGR